MSYDSEAYEQLFMYYIKDCNYMHDLSREHDISIVKTKFNDDLSYFVIRNNYNIYQKMYFKYLYDEITNEVTILNEVKIVDIKDFYLETPFNIDDEISHILFDNIEDYIYWFSTIDENFILPVITPR